MFETKTHNGHEYKQSTSAKDWKIVHEGVNIKHMSCDTASIGTSSTVYATPNFRAMMQYIITNGLDVSSIELIDYDAYFDSVVDGAIMPNDNDLIEFLNTFTFMD
tara:strand:+ start:264 stop:578 length:315 start_codon:yes stop_codon:yes gene_type:complete